MADVAEEIVKQAVENITDTVTDGKKIPSSPEGE